MDSEPIHRADGMNHRFCRACGLTILMATLVLVLTVAVALIPGVW